MSITNCMVMGKSYSKIVKKIQPIFRFTKTNQGNSVGVRSFTRIDSKLDRRDSTLIKTFRFDGETVNGLKISAEGCAVYSYNFMT